MGAATAGPLAPSFGTLAIDAEARSASVEGGELYLSEAEFSLLSALAAEPGRLFTHAELLEACLSGVPGSSVGRIERLAQRLERKLELRGAAGLLRREPGVGFQIESPSGDIGQEGAQQWAPIC
jgi:two-component system, OmpR family, response regulator